MTTLKGQIVTQEKKMDKAKKARLNGKYDSPDARIEEPARISLTEALNGWSITSRYDSKPILAKTKEEALEAVETLLDFFDKDNKD